jgi:DNA-binding transcriptional ArsR family regulator
MMSRIDTRPNPFEFGTEFAPDRLVDREEEVELVVRTAVAMENSPYTQLWTSLTSTQCTMVRAVIEERGLGLRSREVHARYAMASSTATRALRALNDRGVVREDEDGMDIRYRLEDPFLAAWLHWTQKAGL